ncbi:hypothetical protein ABFS82_10G104500 [Erythranthe guttata]
MSIWNYMATAHKPTAVTHACVGSFTGVQEINLILAKCSQIEIYKLLSQESQALKVDLHHMLDVPIYGRIVTLELLRPRGLDHDLLFIATKERHKFCLMEWVEGAVITRSIGDASAAYAHHASMPQMGIVDPDCRLIGFHVYNRIFKFVPLDDRGQLQEAFDIVYHEERLGGDRVLEIKFLYGCQEPTIVVLHQDANEVCNVETYVIDLNSKTLVAGPWYQERIYNSPFPWTDIAGPRWYGACSAIEKAEFLIPVEPPLCGFLVIGGRSIQYFGAKVWIKHNIELSFTSAYGRCGNSDYLVSDHNGILHLIVIDHDEDKVSGLRTTALGETSVASSISYIKDSAIFVGSSNCDSQLIEINRDPDAKGPHVKVYETFVNLGPIVDLCVVNYENHHQVQVVTCSGTSKDGSLYVVRKRTRINELDSVEHPGIKQMWSLQSAADNTHDLFLVVSHANKTCILKMKSEGIIGETQMQGLSSDAETLFCHYANYDQLVQVTSYAVRLVSLTTGKLCDEWLPSEDYLINVGTANATQVLLAIGCNRLVHLLIGDGVLTQGKQTQLDHDISSLHITPTGDQSDGQLAAVGTWTDNSVSILTLPSLKLLMKEPLEGVPRSVLLCSFEGVSYLLCGLGEGHLWNFVLNTRKDELELADGKRVSLGTEPITLCIFSSENATHVFAASYSQQTIIYSNNRKLFYTNVFCMKGVRSVCPFNPDSLSNSFAIAKEDELLFGTMDRIQKLYTDRIKLEGGHCARCICHQEQTQTFVICSSSAKYCGIHLLDDQSFDIKSSIKLDKFETGQSILSCSFSGDSGVYYCIGTVYITGGEDHPTRGRILVYDVNCGKLREIANREMEGGVYSLKAFKGKLLVAVNYDIHFYKWTLNNQGSPMLTLECMHIHEMGRRRELEPFVETRGDFIVAGDPSINISLLTHTTRYPDRSSLTQPECALEMQTHRFSHFGTSAFGMLGDDIYVFADKNLNLFSVRKGSELVPVLVGRYRDRRHQVVTDATPRRFRLEMVGRYYFGDVINRFRHGSFLTTFPDSDVSQIPTLVFGTVSGAIGVMASLSEDKYILLDKLQTNLREVKRGATWLSHKEWRFFSPTAGDFRATNFLDGDFIALFLQLEKNQMEKISKAVEVPVEELKKIVQDLSRLYS